VRQAGAEPPNGAASFLKWRDWGIDVPPSELGPGMVAVYRLDTAAGLPQSTSRLLVGVVLRRQPDCIETIIGNVADRVVITCVAANLLTGVRRPAPIGGPG
jgi:hypothetical protein